jgi:PAS domain S-box-containing protein
MSRMPHTVGLCVANPADRRLLEEFLRQAGHAVLAATPADPDPAGWERVSLLLVDEAAARQCAGQLVALKRRSGAVFLPLLILLPQKADGVAWLKAGFDDVLRLPLTRAELGARLSVFLRLREQAEEQYRVIFENVQIGIYRMTPAGRVLVANPAFARMLGYGPPDELVAQDAPPPLRATPTQRDLARRLECDGQAARIETAWRRRDGRTLHALESARCVRDEAGNLLYFEGTIEDITDRKQAEEELRRTLAREREMKEELAAANRTKDEFLAMVSHELRTPLNAMLGWARLLRGGALDAATAAHALEAIETSAKAQARLIEDLLDISRITTGKLRLQLAPTEPALVIQAALDAVRPAAEAKGVQLVARLAPGVGAVTGDADRLQQVVWNLLTNAVKFTPAGARRPRPRPVHRAPPRRNARRHDPGRERRRGPGDEVHRHPPGRRPP